MKVTFKSIDGDARTATFDVAGKLVTRNIPNAFIGTTDKYLNDLARGLAIEAKGGEITLIEPTIKPDDVLVLQDSVIL